MSENRVIYPLPSILTPTFDIFTPNLVFLKR